MQIDSEWVRELWQQWLEQNHHRFTAPLLARTADKAFIVMGFTGIHPGITLQIGLNGQNNGIYYSWQRADNDSFWDGLYDRDLRPEITGDGLYYCGYCIPEKIVYYPSLEALWQDHIFEELLTWSNENLKPDRVLVPFGKDSWTEACGAMLKTRDDALRLGWSDQSLHIPVINFNDDNNSIVARI